MQEVIPFLNLMKDISEMFGILEQRPIFSRKVWEDNESCIKVAKSPKFTARTKHIAIKYHHFREHVRNKTVKVVHVDTSEQIADILSNQKNISSQLFRFCIENKPAHGTNEEVLKFHKLDAVSISNRILEVVKN